VFKHLCKFCDRFLRLSEGLNLSFFFSKSQLTQLQNTLIHFHLNDFHFVFYLEKVFVGSGTKLGPVMLSVKGIPLLCHFGEVSLALLSGEFRDLMGNASSDERQTKLSCVD
jgi:hypothetical protein